MDVDRAARRIAGDDAYRSRWIGLRGRRARDHQRASAGGQTQELSSVREFHLALATEHYGRWSSCSGLMLAARITLPHFSVSSSINLPKSVGEPTSGGPPKSASRALILASANEALISLLSRSTISAGVALGAAMPHQLLAS